MSHTAGRSERHADSKTEQKEPHTYAYRFLKRCGFRPSQAYDLEQLLDTERPGDLTADEVCYAIQRALKPGISHDELFGQRIITNDQPSLFGDGALYFRHK